MDFIRKHKWEVPLYIIAAGLPLITYFHIQYIQFGDFAWFPNQTTWTDFFLYGKSRCVHFLGLFMAIFLLIGAVRKKNARFEREWLLVLLYGILQLISAFSSAYPQQSFFGGIEQYESVWVLLGYLMIGCYAYQCIIYSESPEKIMTALFLGVFLSCILGFAQLLQHDFWETGLGKQLLIPQAYAELRENLRFNFAQGDWEPVYLASYNPNYAGIYLLMILPCIFLWKNKYKWILGIIVTICMIGTMSKTVIFTAIILIVLCVILFRKILLQIHKIWKVMLVLLTFVFGIVSVIVSGNEADVSDEMLLQEVICEKDYVRITYQGETIRMRDVPQYDGGVKYEICYEDGSHVALKWNEKSGELEPYAENLHGLRFKVYQKDDISYIMFRYGDIPFRFTNDVGTGKYEYVSINGKTDELLTAETVGNLSEEFINGRGYIWNRTLAVVSDNMLLGTGPDTFLPEFPQDDYVIRSNLGHTFFTQILTNAHSLYMHMAMQTGIPSLLCYVGFVLIYLKKSWKLYSGKMEYCFMEKMGIGIFLGVTGYLICGLTFASSVCTTPIFWLLLGLGIGINKINIRE